jgi:hypothetical protein
MSDILHTTAADVAASLLSQPELFGGPAQHPGVVAPLSSALVRRPHTGTVVTKDEGKLLLVSALRTMGHSDRKISALVGVARESIGPILMEAEKRGLVRPLKERLAQAIGLLAEESTAATRELVQEVRDGNRDEGVTMALRALGPIVGISIEKVQLLTGGPTEILETREGRSPEDEAAFLARLTAQAAAAVEARTVDVTPASDSESDGCHSKLLQCNAPSAGDTGHDTSHLAQDASVGGDARPTQSPARGAGGGGAGRVVSQVDGSRGSEISAHGAIAPAAPIHPPTP